MPKDKDGNWVEKSTAKSHAPPPTGVMVQKLKPCPETKRGECKPYVFMERCAKCNGEVTETTGWEARRWTFEGKREVRLLCDFHGRAAKEHYRTGRGMG